MRIKTLFLIVMTIISLKIIGQEKKDNLDFRIGAGFSLLGSGDMVTFNYENEINYKLNPYFTSSISINLGRSNLGVFETASFTQSNINAYFSPFKNNKRFDFRIGTGLTYYAVSDAYMQSANYNSNGILVDADYVFENRNAYGFNMIIENSYLLNDKFLIGLKLFSQPYFNLDINSGLLIKLGLRL